MLRLLVINIDGASRGNPGPSSIGVVVRDASGRTLRSHARAIGRETNNVAEYTALLDALRLARDLGGKALRILSDSELLVRQFNGVYRVRNPRICGLMRQAQALRRGFESVKVEHVRREDNAEADGLANRALDAPGGSPG